MRTAVVVVACALLLSGCGTYSWYHPNVPPEIAQRDSDECREYARRLVTLTLIADSEEALFVSTASLDYRLT